MVIAYSDYELDTGIDEGWEDIQVSIIELYFADAEDGDSSWAA